MNIEIHPKQPIRIELPSRVEFLNLVQGIAEEIAQVCGMPEDERLDFGLAVREGAINAMKHAHGFNPGLPVALEFALDQNRTTLSVSILDQGNGFDPATVSDPTAPENLLKSSGRGLLLIRSLVDEFDVLNHEGGTELVLVKKIGALRDDESAHGGDDV
ncbi:MAG: ATP-binding protein [Acidobacteriota bacterium]|nr:MAG: ATP-binding protein [Acidobacteriota bacterium]